MGGFLPLAPGVSTVRYPIPERIFDYVCTVRSATAGTCHKLTSLLCSLPRKLIAYPGQRRPRVVPTGDRDTPVFVSDGVSITNVRVGKAKSMSDCFARSMIRN